MSVARLANWALLPHDAVECTVPSWDDPAANPRMLTNLRAGLWTLIDVQGTTIYETVVDFFRSSGYETHARLVRALLGLREGPLDYDAVLLSESLEDLVREVIAAVRSVDASSQRAPQEMGADRG
ncbi:hypothetical protein C8R47DRAFT_1083095 [Mycena vitilis]|nr:hypothetical protein C8R47DRAFT_1083095 [Mycena vitilis]